MLAKKYRLPIQNFLKKNGRIIKTPYFLLKIFPNNFKFNRFGIIISKKVSKKATDRNRTKRVIFDVAQNFLSFDVGEQKPRLSMGKDFLIIISPKIMGLGKTEIMDSLKKVLT